MSVGLWYGTRPGPLKKVEIFGISNNIMTHGLLSVIGNNKHIKKSKRFFKSNYDSRLLAVLET